MTRDQFRTVAVDRDGGECVVPWCDAPVTEDPDGPGEVHHIIERRLWDDGGYLPDNGASVCNVHHRYAEENVIPPQSFWRWVGVEDPPLPGQIEDMNVDKWGESLKLDFDPEIRDKPKYPSTRHLPYSHAQDRDDTQMQEVGFLCDIPLVVTVKMDGGNCMIVRDMDEPTRARNGRHPGRENHDQLRQMYWDRGLYDQIPEHIQIFGEWLYETHSIHYGCDGCEHCSHDDSLPRDPGPEIDGLFQVFGVYDTRYQLWTSWPEVEAWARKLDFPTVPVLSMDWKDAEPSITRPDQIYDPVRQYAEDVVQNGHEGIVVRSKFGYHRGQIGERLGKYVREDHVIADEHWTKLSNGT
jgi:hypothetical protein